MSEQNKIIINRFENAFGIKKLSVNLPGSGNAIENCAIYASNGVFKSSFSNAINSLAKDNGDAIEDRLTGNKFIYDITVGTSTIDDYLKNILVFSKDIYDSISLHEMQNPLSRLTTGNAEIEKLLVVEGKFLEYKKMFEGIIKKSGFTPDFVYSLFGLSNSAENIVLFIELLRKISAVQSINGIEKLKAKTLTTKVGDALDKEDLQVKFKSYSEYVNNQLSSIFFDDKFNDTTVTGFIKVLESTSFINSDKNRYIVVNGTEYKDIDSFKKAVDNQIKKIIDDPKAKELIVEFEKNLGTSKEAQDIKVQIKDDTDIARLLSHGRKNLVLSNLKVNFIDDIDRIIDDLYQLKSEVDEILLIADKSVTNFEVALQIFKKRFNSIFDVRIKDKGLTVLGRNAPVLIFSHNSEPTANVDEQTLNKILSSGEKTTLNIIKFIVEYELIKNNKPIIILDDIIETFDYANRYAFMQYINEMVKNKGNVVLLTHNYEFYRSSIKRCNLVPLVATLNKSKKAVSINKNSRLLFDPYRASESPDITKLIFSIPFAREISILTDKCQNQFLPYLHFTKETNLKSLSDLHTCVNEIFPKTILDPIPTESYYEKLMSLCEYYSSREFDTFDMEAKIILSIGIRMLFEKLIIGEDFTKVEGIVENQTRVLLDTYKEQLNENVIAVGEDVCLITPEFIHINSFMYEPLIDIDSHKIKQLYISIKAFIGMDIWIS